MRQICIRVYAIIDHAMGFNIYEFAKKVWIENKAKGNLIRGSLPYRKNESMRSVPNLKFIFEDIIK